jgi:hypothetical protein
MNILRFNPQLLLFVVSVPLFWVGCSSVSRHPTGFLGDVESLRPENTTAGRRLYVADGFLLDRSVGLVIEPVELRLPADDLARLDAPTQKRLREEAEASLRAAWSKHLPLTDDSSATLRLRTAITQVDLSNPALNAATTVLLFLPFDVGGIAVESELRDSRSGKRVAAVIDVRSGSPLNVIASFSPTGQARRLFDCITEDFAEAVCGGKSPASRAPERTEETPEST